MYQQTAICCTLNNVPMSSQTLKKSRLPFGVHLYPFAYDESLPVSQEGPIVRCAICRAYINPYIRMLDQSSWQCNLCGRINEMPSQFVYDYANQQYYNLNNKLELNSESLEYIASVEYMIRPPQPACYMFVFDCSQAAAQVGYIPVMAAAIADLIDQIPGDGRASIGFIAYDSAVHYFTFYGTQIVHHVSPDVSDVTIPCSSDGILANLTSKRDAIIEFLSNKLSTFPYEDGCNNITDTRSALGPAIRAAVKIMSPIGGQITVLLAQLPNHGSPEDGSVLQKREIPDKAASDKDGSSLTPLLNPASDYYKALALECCEKQISIDIFDLATSYVDLASVSPLAKFSAGSIFHYSNNPSELKTTLVRFDQDFRNHLVRPIGLESVLRLRYSRGLKIHTFHGNFFVRSPNLLVLPNANPDASYALQIAIEEDLKPETRFVYFQASILYTTPEGERRIRVHTARYPTVTTLPEVIYGANQTAIVALLAKMAVDKSMETRIGDAREALVGAGVDLLEAYLLADEDRARAYPMGLPENLRSIPLYILALLKHRALRLDHTTKLDDRYAAMELFKTLPTDELITYMYPDMFPINNIENDEEWKTPIQLSAGHIQRTGAYLLDAYDVMIVYVCEYVDPSWCQNIFGVNNYSQIPEQTDIGITTNQFSAPTYPRGSPANFLPPQPDSFKNGATPSTGLSVKDIAETPLIRLPELENPVSSKLRDFINCLIDSRPQKPKFYVLKDNSRARHLFIQYLIDDRSDNYYSYPEFWRFLQDQAHK